MRAIVLFSGGLDSTVMLGHALSKDRECIALSFDYRQRNQFEIEAATAIAKHYNVKHKIISISPNTFAASALIPSSGARVPKDRTGSQIYHGVIPNTYVPGRNTLFIAYAIGQAEIYECGEIYVGVNAADRNGYPDARPEFIQAMQTLITLATKQAVETTPPQIVTPLIKWHKHEIVRHGLALKVPVQLTLSCYDPGKELLHCGRCDACYLRKEGFMLSGHHDPTSYADHGVPLGAAEIY